MPEVPPQLADAYDACARLARQHYENFPVASRLLPGRMRPHIATVYAFARVADDMADEGDRPAEQRHQLLDAWQARLDACAGGTTATAAAATRLADAVTSEMADHIFRALGHTIRTRRLPVSLFEDLLSAFRQDITTDRYATWTQLLDYCRRSANPVGRLVLRIAGIRDPVLDRASDGLCTALQLTNFWQDLERDWLRGRLYVPAEDRAACDATTDDLDARRLGPAWHCVLQRVATRTRELFAVGRPVCDGVHGRLRLELRLTWLGGLTILDRLERGAFDVFEARPRLRKHDLWPLLWRAARWR